MMQRSGRDSVLTASRGGRDFKRLLTGRRTNGAEAGLRAASQRQSGGCAEPRRSRKEWRREPSTEESEGVREQEKQGQEGRLREGESGQHTHRWSIFQGPRHTSYQEWPTPQPQRRLTSLRPSPCPTCPCRSRRSTPFTTAGTWPASSSSCSSSSPSYR